MAKKPLNPDSVKGGGMPAMGRSSQGASAAANKRAGAGAAAKKAQASTKVKVTRGFGTINKEGFAKLQKMQEPGVRFYTAAQRGIKPQPAAGSVEQVKLTAKQFGQKVSGREARAISALLRGRNR